MRKVLFALYLPMLLSAREYGFEEILEKALTNNNSLKAKKIDIEIAKARLSEISAKKFGELNIGHNYTKTNHAGYVFMNKLSSREATFADFGFRDFLAAQNSGQNPLSIAPDELNNPKARDNYESFVEYKLPIFAGFALSNQEAAAKKIEEAARLFAIKDEKALAVETLKAYNNAVAAKKYLDAMQISKKSVELIVSNTSEMLKEKLASKTDMMEAEYADSVSRVRLFEAQKNYDVAISYLKFLTDDEAVDGVSGFYEPPTGKSGELQRDDIAAKSAIKEASKKMSDASFADFYPKVFAFAKYGYNDNTLSFSSSKDFYLAGVGLSYNITDFGATSAKNEGARAEFLKASYDEAATKSFAKFELKQKELELKQKELQLTEAKSAKSLASNIFENYKIKYKNGLATVSDLVKKEAEDSLSAAAFIGATAAYLNAKAEYKYALGQGVKE